MAFCRLFVKSSAELVMLKYIWEIFKFDLLED